MKDGITLEARVKSLETSVDLILHHLRDIQRRQGLLIQEKIARSPHKLGAAIFQLLSSSYGTPVSKKHLLTLLSCSQKNFDSARKELIRQGKMVDGTGTDLEPFKICMHRGGYVIFTPEQVKQQLELRVERRRERERRRETQSC